MVQVLLILLVSAFILYQDVKYRQIHFLLPVILLGIGFASIPGSGFNFFTNMIFVTVNLLGVTLYYFIKTKQLINLINTHIGIGDIVYFIAIAPFFTLQQYVFFFTGGLIFSLLLFVLLKKIRPTEQTVPLAGFLSIYFVGMYLVIF